MLYWNTFTCAVLLAFATVDASAQSQAVPVQMDVDEATFAYDDEYSLAEVYLAFEATGLPFQQRGSSFIAELPLQVVIVRKTDAELQSDSVTAVWEDDSGIAFAVGDTSTLQAGQYFLHQFRTLLPPGEYELRITVPGDADSGRKELELRRALPVQDYSGRGAALSEATLASDIRPSTDRGSPFYKNGFLIRPNAYRLYGDGLDRLFYYIESYGTTEMEGQPDTYVLYSFVAEANRTQPFGGLEQRVERDARSPDVMVGSFDLSDVPSGSYFLHFAILDESNTAVAESSRKLFVYNPDVEREMTVFLEETFETSEYATMPAERVERELEYARLIANVQERRRMRGLEDLDAQRRFLMDFWKARDPNPGTPLNEFQREFMQRVEFANERYGSSYQEGWKSDRGRVLIRYGQPAEIEPYLYDRELLPHEIWQYDNIPGEGQAIFVFADRTSFGQFELIHSSVAGERSLPAWQSELRR